MKQLKYLLLICLSLAFIKSKAHPMPGSLVNLFILEKTIKGEAKIPLIELQNALGEQTSVSNSNYFIKYFHDHISASTRNQKWATQINSISVTENIDPIIGKYKEVEVFFSLTPPHTVSVRKFLFNYDAVIHQVITHKILVSIQQDWFNGIQEKQEAQQIGIIQLDIPSGKYAPLEVNLEPGSKWKGFKGMLKLGMEHIKEGTDHLLFLLVLLLPAMLLVSNRKWESYGGLRYSIIALLKIVTAFTVGHSITLLMGVLGWIKLPLQPVEILIALSIFVSAIHAIKPIFVGKEMYIALFFGLVHGLAFATVLANLHATASIKALSILGFNIGIEIMQLGIITLILPWLLLISKTPYYKWLKNGIAILASIASIAWIVERSSEKENFISRVSINISSYGLWYIIIFATFSVIIFTYHWTFTKK